MEFFLAETGSNPCALFLFLAEDDRLQSGVHTACMDQSQLLNLFLKHFHLVLKQVTFESTEPSTLQVSVTVSTKKKTTDETVDVMVALYENGLVTECTAGENRGKLLTNEYVVRGLETACTLQEGVPKKPVSGQVLFELWPGFSTSTTGIVIFLQNPTSKEIYGAEHFQLPVTL